MRLIRLFAYYVSNFTRSNVVLAIRVLSPRMKLDRQFIELETRAERPYEILALSNLITFTPGTLMLDIEPGERIIVHVLGDAEEAKRTILEQLEEPLMGDKGDRA